MMMDYYERRAPKMNLHLINGHYAQAAWQFIIIGVLRTTVDLDQVDAPARFILMVRASSGALER